MKKKIECTIEVYRLALLIPLKSRLWDRSFTASRLSSKKKKGKNGDDMIKSKFLLTIITLREAE